jgi:hypothetical protein
MLSLEFSDVNMCHCVCMRERERERESFVYGKIKIIIRTSKIHILHAYIH